MLAPSPASRRPLPRPLSAWRIALVCAVSAAACSAHLPVASSKHIRTDQRRHVPATAPMLRFVPPVPESFVLDNNLTVYVVNKPNLPLVFASLVVRSGSAADLPGQEGGASLLADAAKLGTASRSAEAIAEQMEGMGASLDVGVGVESTQFAAQLLRDTLEQGLDVLADVALRPALQPAEVQRAKDARLGELAQREAEPSACAQAATRRLVYGDHPYGHLSLGTRKSVAALTPAMLRAHHERALSPHQSALVFVGDIDVAQARTLASHAFGAWNADATSRAMATLVRSKAPPTLGEAGTPTTPRDLAPTVALIDRPNSPQAECTVAGLGIARSAPEYPQLVLANAILGGMFNSRINMNLREEKGWTYGARSSFQCFRERGLFSIGSALRTDVAIDGVREMFAEIDKMRALPVSFEEMRAAKNRHVLSVAGSMERLGELAAQSAELFIYGLPLDYYRELPHSLEKVTEADVLAATQKFIDPARLHVVVVGDRAKTEQKLLGLHRGAIQLMDASATRLGVVHADESHGDIPGKPAH